MTLLQLSSAQLKGKKTSVKIAENVKMMENQKGLLISKSPKVFDLILLQCFPSLLFSLPSPLMSHCPPSPPIFIISAQKEAFKLSDTSQRSVPCYNQSGELTGFLFLLIFCQTFTSFLVHSPLTLPTLPFFHLLSFFSPFSPSFSISLPSNT